MPASCRKRNRPVQSSRFNVQVRAWGPNLEPVTLNLEHTLNCLARLVCLTLLCVPLIALDSISFVGDQAGNPSLHQLGFELLANPWILIRVFDHILGAVFDLLGVAAKLPRRMKRQVAG